MRGRIPELAAEKGEGFVHNSMHYATANFPINPSTPLHEIALQNRKAVLICEPHHKLYASSNWSGSWQGIDLSKAAPESYTMTGNEKQSIVVGQSRTQRSPMRCRNIDTPYNIHVTSRSIDRVVALCRTDEGFGATLLLR